MITDFKAVLEARTMPYNEACKQENLICATHWYIKEALSAVNSHWGKDMTQQNEYMSKTVTRTDEAFVLWTLETSKDSWIQSYEAEINNVAEAKNKGEDNDMDDDEDKGPNRFGSEAGMELFEKMAEIVQKTRDSVFCADWDKQMQVSFRDNFKKPKRLMEKKSRTSKKRKYEKNFDMMVDNF